MAPFSPSTLPVTVLSSPSLPARLLVLGAGWLGQPLAEAFAADGVVVTTVRRTPHAPPAGGAAVALDVRALADPAAPIPDTLRQHDAVVALVAPDRQRGDDHVHTYPAAARAAARIAHASGARALAWISSTGVYGYTDGREVDEATPLRAEDRSQRALIEAEEAVLATATDQLATGVFRVAGLYGPGRDPAGRYRDVDALAGRQSHWVNLAWRDDVIAAVRVWFAHVLAADRASVPRVLNVADGAPLLVSECARLVALADGRTVSLPPATAVDASTTASATRAPTRSNQRILVHTLRSLGWRPSVPNLRAGLLRLGYARLTATQPSYGPQTDAVRRFLQRLAVLDAEARARVVAEWMAHRDDASFRRAERVLGEVMARSGREAERDAAAGPLLQMLRVPRTETKETASSSPDDPLAALDPIAEPALAALLALLVRDLLPADTFRALVTPLASLVPDAGSD
jgi:nucleoside-diphosphate-sugar epimerase